MQKTVQLARTQALLPHLQAVQVRSGRVQKSGGDSLLDATETKDELDPFLVILPRGQLGLGVGEHLQGNSIRQVDLVRA